MVFFLSLFFLAFFLGVFFGFLLYLFVVDDLEMERLPGGVRVEDISLPARLILAGGSRNDATMMLNVEAAGAGAGVDAEDADDDDDDDEDMKI